jgi:hypothetical protein
MRSFINLKTVGAGAAAALAMGLASATPAAAQSYGDPLIDAAVRAVLGVSTQDNRYYGQQGNYRGPDCQYYRDGRCYRNLGHWEREHGINSRDRSYGYGNNGYGGYVEGRTYSGRGYYRDGRFWRNHGEWRSWQNHSQRDYRYDRRW